MLVMPAIALRGMTLLPGMIAHFDISRDKSIKAVEAAMNDNQKIYLVTQRDAEVDNPKLEDLFEIGIIAEIKQVIKMQNNIVRVLVEGQSRAQIHGFDEYEAYLNVEIESLEEVEEFLQTIDADIKVAVMGCCVNGPGEAKDADIGIAGGIKEGLFMTETAFR